MVRRNWRKTKRLEKKEEKNAAAIEEKEKEQAAAACTSNLTPKTRRGPRCGCLCDETTSRATVWEQYYTGYPSGTLDTGVHVLVPAGTRIRLLGDALLRGREW